MKTTPKQIKYKGAIYVKAADRIVAENSKAAFIDYDQIQRQIANTYGKGWILEDLPNAKPKSAKAREGFEITYPSQITNYQDKLAKAIKADLIVGVYEIEDGIGITYHVVAKG